MLTFVSVSVFVFVFEFVLSDSYLQKVMYAQTQFQLTHIHINP